MSHEQDNLEFKVSQYLDGQLSPKETADFEELLGRDARLREELQRYASLNEMLGSLAMPEELNAVDFVAQRQDIMARLERRALTAVRQPRVIYLLARGALAAAAVLVLAVSAALFFRNGGTKAQPVVAQSTMERLEPVGMVQSVMAQAPMEDDAVVISQLSRQPKMVTPPADRATIDLEPAQASTVITWGGPSKSKPQRQGGGMTDLLIE